MHLVGFMIDKFVTMHGHMNVKYPLFVSDFNETFDVLERFSKKKYTNIKFHQNPSSGSLVVAYGRTDV